MQVGLGGASQAVLLGPGKIDNQSLVEMHEVSLSDLWNNSMFCGIAFLYVEGVVNNNEIVLNSAWHPSLISSPPPFLFQVSNKVEYVQKCEALQK